MLQHYYFFDANTSCTLPSYMLLMLVEETIGDDVPRSSRSVGDRVRDAEERVGLPEDNSLSRCRLGERIRRIARELDLGAAAAETLNCSAATHAEEEWEFISSGDDEEGSISSSSSVGSSGTTERT